ncbi:MAG: hypothetical protein A2W41_02245 [Candidatus Ryanbacteria bacterium RIFCSPHIGHO2_01_45_13]|uniref:Uncharacterized protein n=1 Tax=Candidatus Ryanbacteria bacterium RIFCSPHIGHO2_01_45_13 TaxID=1802112 RepID=A0A1G2FXV4_9BACT|nr:MAG: hypothetical protein A2W41_02245 [Candidatus Ryanbacteria bacterium RIFCSPHIGHO2_01_45_13]
MFRNPPNFFGERARRFLPLNPSTPCPQTKGVAPPPRAVERGAEQKNFLFLLGRKNWWRAKNQKCKESFSARQAAVLGGWLPQFRNF